MRKNTLDTFHAWRDGRALRASAAIWTDGDAVYSYGTAILARASGRAVAFNVTRYSKTTTQHQNGLRTLLRFEGIRPVEVDGLGRGVSVPFLLAEAAAVAGRAA